MRFWTYPELINHLVNLVFVQRGTEDKNLTYLSVKKIFFAQQNNFLRKYGVVAQQDRAADS
ncbi:MAG: hypothetical protein K9G65_04140 [Rickettsiaceae bacterium]|nr:hypothetical protein [Rickettsiaceae bacterium]